MIPMRARDYGLTVGSLNLYQTSELSDSEYWWVTARWTPPTTRPG